MDVSISIVSYNTNTFLKRCLTSIYKHLKNIKFEVFVVDNGSTDGTVAMVKKEFPQVTLIANKKNKFFAKANNQALKRASGRYCLVLNADTYFIDNSLKKMIDYMEENPEVGACDGLELYENGKILPTGSGFSNPLIDFYELSLIGKRITNRKIINRYRLSNKNRKNIFPIDVGCDAFLMIRRDILKTIGWYDDDLLLFYTENDLCLRIKELGYKIMHFGSAKVMHTVSVSTNKLGWKKMDIYYKDLLCYYKKHDHVFDGTLLFFLLQIEKVLLQIRELLREKLKRSN